MAELEAARAILAKMLDRGVAAAPFDPRHPSDVAVDAKGHGKLWSMLNVHEGYLDDLELVNASRFPDPATVRVSDR